MAYQTYQLTEGDECNIDMVCEDDDGSVIDITNASPIIYHWKQKGQVLTTKTASVQDGPNGVARFSTDTTDVLSGDLLVQVETTINSKTRRADPFLFRVGSKLA